jgi:hypothetical protein
MVVQCPQRNEKTGVNIIYGYPIDEAYQHVERNEAVLGGCVQEIGEPDSQCLSCGNRWLIARSRKRAQRANSPS